GYNAGENAVLRYKGIPPYRETQGYVRKIQALLGGGLPNPLRMVSFAPSHALDPAPAGPAAKPGPIVPARPRTYYKWRDGTGQLHVAQTPPEDAPYTMIRALD